MNGKSFLLHYLLRFVSISNKKQNIFWIFKYDRQREPIYVESFEPLRRLFSKRPRRIDTFPKVKTATSKY